MNSYALLETTDISQQFKIINVIVADAEFIKKIPGNWVEDASNTAMVNGFYDANNRIFFPQSPYQSWRFNKSSHEWQAPIPMPTDGRNYYWDDLTDSWKEIITTISPEPAQTFSGTSPQMGLVQHNSQQLQTNPP